MPIRAETGILLIMFNLDTGQQERARYLMVTVGTQNVTPAIGEHAVSKATEHFEEFGGGGLGSALRDRSQFPHQTLPVYSAKLVQNHLPTFSLEANRYSRRVRPGDCGHRSNDDGLQMLVHFIGRDDKAKVGSSGFQRPGWDPG